MPFTRGFESQGKLIDHFDRHGMDFGATSEADYEALADTFLGGPRRPGTQEGRRRNGDIIRYNIMSREFGIVTADGFILTYWRLNTRDNMAYFRRACNQ